MAPDSACDSACDSWSSVLTDCWCVYRQVQRSAGGKQIRAFEVDMDFGAVLFYVYERV